MATQPLASDGLHFFTILASQKMRSAARSRRRSRDGVFVNCWIDVEQHRWIHRSGRSYRWVRQLFQESQTSGLNNALAGV